jgi:hypothetical protein
MTDKQLADQIRLYRRAPFNPAGLYNLMTNPTILRTDRQHKAAARAARWARRRAHSYVENENGKLVFSPW